MSLSDDIAQLKRRLAALERTVEALDPKAFYDFDPHGRRSFTRSKEERGGGRRQITRGKKISE